LTREQIRENAETYKAQICHLLGYGVDDHRLQCPLDECVHV
jgi:hypothetical protein